MAEFTNRINPLLWLAGALWSFILALIGLAFHDAGESLVLIRLLVIAGLGFAGLLFRAVLD